MSGSGHSIMFVTSNGAGLGHLTRAMSIARRLPTDVGHVIVTQSQGAPLVRREGFTVEYVPSHGYVRGSRPRWHDMIEQRADELQELYRPAVVVFDGAVPYTGLLRAWRRYPGVKVWLRRGSWKASALPTWAALADRFDLVIEPGDLSSASDHGPTAAQRDRVLRVGPITYLDRDELLDRSAARAELGLDERGTTALLTLGAGNINDITSPVRLFAAALRERGIRAVVAQSPISHGDLQVPDDVLVRRAYPISRYLNAFDFGIAAAGYNSFHEAASFGLPTVLVPNRSTGLDDQVARARAAERFGIAVNLDDEATAREIAVALDVVERPSSRSLMRRRAARLAGPNGAHRAAKVLAGLAGHQEDDR